MVKSRNKKLNVDSVDALMVILHNRGNSLEHLPTTLPHEEVAFGHIAPHINSRSMDGKATTLPNPDKYFARFPTLANLPREVFEPFPWDVQDAIEALTSKNNKKSPPARR